MHPRVNYNDKAVKLKVDSIAKYEKFALSNQHFLLKVFAGIFTGKPWGNLPPQGDNSNAYQRANYIAMYTGLDLMLRALSLKPGVLQNVIQKHLAAYDAPDAVRTSLCRLRIAASKETIRLRDIAHFFVSNWISFTDTIIGGQGQCLLANLPILWRHQ
jgi:hypothetical protein